jgi:hypothetical protein
MFSLVDLGTGFIGKEFIFGNLAVYELFKVTAWNSAHVDGVLVPRLRILDGVARPPMDMSGNVF